MDSSPFEDVYSQTPGTLGSVMIPSLKSYDHYREFFSKPVSDRKFRRIKFVRNKTRMETPFAKTKIVRMTSRVLDCPDPL